MLRPFRLALGLLTRIPVSNSGEIRPGDQGRSMLWYPMVGLIIGMVLMLLALPLQTTDSLVVSALLLTIWVAITGALHLDGLADSADAWLGSHADKERALEIMKDPACGPAGVVALVLVLLLKFAAVQALLGRDDLLALMIAPVLARTMLPLLFITTEYVRQGGMASVMVEELPGRPLIAVLIAVAAATVILAGGQGAWLLLGTLAVGWWLRRLMILRLGGTTGDTAGAMVEIVEAVVLVEGAVLTAL